MDTRCRELITTDESPVIAVLVLNAMVMENSEGDGRFPNPPCTNESDGFKVFSETDNLFD